VRTGRPESIPDIPAVPSDGVPGDNPLVVDGINLFGGPGLLKLTPEEMEPGAGI
jgi:hypothetical protein